MKDITFKSLTNKYSLQRTLRFALEPVSETENIIKSIIESDKDRAKSYLDIKPILDELHEDFINQSLEQANVDFSDYFRLFEEILELKTQKQKQTDKNQKSKLEIQIKQRENEKTALEEKLRKEICKLYEITAREWKNKYVDEKGKPILKNKSHEILTEASILKVLETIHKDDYDKISIIQKFHGFFTYFIGFNENRRNYYSDQNKSTSIANRIINENLPKFCQNITKFRRSKAIFELDQDLKENFHIFELNNYNKFLTQDGIDNYNALIGKFNSFINRYNQQHKDQPSLSLFNTLFKQIGSIKVNKAFIFEIDENENTLENILTQFADKSQEISAKIEKLINTLLETDDLDGIYVNKRSITELSNLILVSWDTLGRRLSDVGVWEKDKKTDGFKEKENTSIREIIDSIESYTDEESKYLFKDEFQDLDAKNRFLLALKKLCETRIKLYNSNLEKLQKLLREQNDLRKSKDVIKGFCDSAIDLIRLVKLFSVKNLPENINTEFYSIHEDILEDPEYPVFKWYDAIRNYLTKKPYSLDKIKLNFEKGNLLAGWPDSPEGNTQYCGFIFRKNSEYYLGISLNTRLFDAKKYKEAYENTQNSQTEKMVYKQIDAKTIYGSVYRGKYHSKYSEDVNSLSDDELIQRIKSILQQLQEYYPNMNQILDTKYEKAIDLARAISKSKFSTLGFVKINEDYLYKCVLNKEKPLFLFKITNKDLSKKNKGTKDNLHTKYWKALFEDANSNIKLNGGAEIFFRPASLKEKVNIQTITNKRNINHAIKHARFTKDRYLFHVPITLNYESEEDKRITDKIREIIRSKNGEINIIGIDRGEKHLAYYCVIDPHGNILQKGSLNKDLLGKDYAEKLEKIARERQSARKNWDEITKIKDLKEGYISQVVKRIADLAVKYEALIVFEDLNVGFKRGRQKIEKSVYQKLELAIAKKLSYYVSKDSKENEICSVTKALQLVPPVENYGDIKGKQFGIILYTRANYTSQTDPLTGWRKSIYIQKGSEQSIKNQIINTFSDIYFDGKDYVFVYEDKGKVWKLYSGINGKPLDRYRTTRSRNKGEWITEKVDHVSILDTLFSKFDKRVSLLDQIKQGTELTKVERNLTAFESLRYAIDIIMQIRNTGLDEVDNDFILSPVRDENGVHYDSRKASVDQPESGDANGAYNIARKGLLMSKKIAESMTEKPDLLIRDEEWDKAAANWDKLFNRRKWTM